MIHERYTHMCAAIATDEQRHRRPFEIYVHTYINQVHRERPTATHRANSAHSHCSKTNEYSECAPYIGVAGKKRVSLHSVIQLFFRGMDIFREMGIARGMDMFRGIGMFRGMYRITQHRPII